MLIDEVAIVWDVVVINMEVKVLSVKVLSIDVRDGLVIAGLTDTVMDVLIGALVGFSLAVIIAVVTDVDVGVLADMRYDMVTGLEFAVET